MAETLSFKYVIYSLQIKSRATSASCILVCPEIIIRILRTKEPRVVREWHQPTVPPLNA